MSCKEQAREAASRYDAFEEQESEVAVILPESRKNAKKWQESLDLPFPLLADPKKKVGEMIGQKVRFGFLGRMSDLIGRMPAAVLIGVSGNQATITETHIGNSIEDRPSIEEFLRWIQSDSGGH